MSHRRREMFAQAKALRSSRETLSGVRRKRETRVRNAAAVLSDQDIWHEYREGNICIEPFKTRNLTHSSYFVTMGDQYYVFVENDEYLNPWNKRRIAKHWEGPYKAVTINDEMFQKCGIPIGKRAIIIPSKTTILGHTQEFIAGLNYIITELRGRKLLSYSGLTISSECGWGEIGDITRHTLVIRNTTDSPAVIPVGAKIARVFFHYTGLPKNYLKGITQTTADMDVISKEWNPSSLLPSSTNKSFDIEKMIEKDQKEHSVSSMKDEEEPFDEEFSDTPTQSKSHKHDEKHVSLD